MVRVYRQAHGLFAVSGIAYNHESNRRGENFVRKKIVRSAIEIAGGSSKPLILGNLNSERDWGYAPEYVNAMWLMLQQERPRDLILATGRSCSVRLFACEAFLAAGIPIRFEGVDESEVGVEKSTGRVLIKVSPDFFRKVDTTSLVGNPKAAADTIGWHAVASGVEVARKMIDSELQSIANGRNSRFLN